MPTFRYTAKNHDAKTVAGKIEADTQQAVIEELRKRSLIVINVIEEKKQQTKVFSERKKKIKAEDIVIFSRQLATMVDAGIPIIQSFEALHEQMSNPTMKKVIIAIRDDIKMGNSLSAAFAKHPKVFDSLYVNMIKVGETGGVLTTILERVSSYLEASMKLKRKVQAAMIYPMVIFAMTGIITLVLLVKVVPTFANIYASFDQELPAMTQMLLAISELIKGQILWYIPIVFIVWMIFAQVYKTEKGRYKIDHMKLRLPIFGDLICKVAVSRFSRTLAILIQSGVPILESLEIVGKTCGNRVLEVIVDEIKENVREGESISGPLAKSDVFPPMVTRMIAIGEKSGKLEKMLSKVAEFYDDQVDTAVSTLTSLIEPVVIGVLGIVIGFIVIALFLPIINITAII